MTLFWKGVRKFVTKWDKGGGVVNFTQKPCEVIYGSTHTLHLHFNSRFPGEPGSVTSHSISSSTCSRKEHSWTNGTCFYGSDVLPVTHPTGLKHWRKFKALKPHARSLTHSLTHSLLRLTSEGRSKLHIERSWACDQITSISQSAMTFSMVDLVYASSLLQGDFHLWHW